MAKHSCMMCQLASELARGDNQDVHRSVATVLKYVIKQLGAHASDILIYDSHSQTLQFAGGCGFHTRAFETSSQRVVLAGQVIRERGVVRHSNLRRTNTLGEFAQSSELLNEGFVSYIGAPLATDDQLCGVLEIFHRDQLNPSSDWLAVLTHIAEQGTHAIRNRLMVRQLRQANSELAQAYDDTLENWARALELRGLEPLGHSQRVTDMTVAFARVMGVNEASLIQVRRGAMLHDIGKMGIADSILLKPETLNEAEWKIVCRHPVIAYEQLMLVEFLRPAIDIPYCHHEKWDGTGYPRGLAGEQIPLAARLFALVDVWDSLGSDKSYRQAWSADKVRQYLSDQGGKSFDPKLADLFVKLLASDELKRKKANSLGVLPGTYAETVFRI